MNVNCFSVIEINAERIVGGMFESYKIKEFSLNFQKYECVDVPMFLNTFFKSIIYMENNI